MDINKIIFSLISILLFNIGCFASPHAIVTLKDGTVTEGNIVVQRPGADITIEADNATIVVAPNDLVSSKARKVKYENLPKEWKRWVLENKALKGDSYGRYAVMEDIKTKKYSFPGVINKQDDEKKNTIYLQVVPSTMKFNWNDVQSIQKIYSNDTKYDLIDEIVTTKGKVYSGKITSQIPGSDVTIETDNSKVRVKTKEIKEIRKHKPKGSGSSFDLVDYINVIKLKDGTEKSGLITLNHYGNKEKDNYLTLLSKNGNTEKILISKIAEYITKYDSDKKPEYQPGRVYINEFKANKAKIQREGNNIVCIDKQAFPFPEGIEISFKSNGKSLNGNWRLIALKEIGMSNGRISWGYNTRDKDNFTIPSKSSDSQSSINTLTFGYISPGFYALVNDSDTEQYVFKIIK